MSGGNGPSIPVAIASILLIAGLAATAIVMAENPVPISTLVPTPGASSDVAGDPAPLGQGGRRQRDAEPARDGDAGFVGRADRAEPTADPPTRRHRSRPRRRRVAPTARTDRRADAPADRRRRPPPRPRGRTASRSERPRPTRIEIAGLGIDIPVIAPADGRARCGVAQWLEPLKHPATGETVYLYGNAVAGTFRPIYTAVEARPGGAHRRADHGLDGRRLRVDLPGHRCPAPPDGDRLGVQPAREPAHRADRRRRWRHDADREARRRHAVEGRRGAPGRPAARLPVGARAARPADATASSLRARMSMVGFGRPNTREDRDQYRRRSAVSLHVRVRHRGAPGQALRPGFGRHPRRPDPAGPPRPRRVRGRDDHRTRPGARRDHDERRVRRHPVGRPRDGPRDRLHARRVRLRLPDLRDPRLDQGAVVRHRAGRRRGARSPRRGRPRQARAGRRRPGDDVRVRLPRDPGADAPPDRAGPPDGPPPGRGPQVRPAPVPPPRRQDPGHRRVQPRRSRSR